MGILADFFVATPEQALRYANSPDEPDGGQEIRTLLRPSEYKGFTDLHVGILWAILAGVEWNVRTHIPESIFLGGENESWLNRFPDELTSLLATASADVLERACSAWASTEEVACDPKELAPVIADLQALAKRAIKERKSVYLWGCQ